MSPRRPPEPAVRRRTAAVPLIAGLIFSRAIDDYFVELDHMAISAKLAVFRDELRGLGSEQQMPRREAELLELARSS